MIQIRISSTKKGMDPQSRHLTWSFIKNFKNENKCTIILTTHYMEEVALNLKLFLLII